MLKRSHYKNRYLPYLLVGPQLLITVFFFFWPAGEALVQAFLISDPFGLQSQFVWFDNFSALFEGSEYINSFIRTLIFSAAVCLLSLLSGLFLAALVNRGAKNLVRSSKLLKSIFILPYAIAPAIAGALWMFLFHPNLGLLANMVSSIIGEKWNPVLDGDHAFFLVILASSWKQVSYNFVFFLGGLQAIPKSLLESAAIDGAGPFRRFFHITLPLLSPTIFFLVVMNLVYAFFDTFGIIHTITEGGPGGATNILVYKVYSDGFVGLDLGSSAVQSVILMALTIGLTIIQFKYVEKKVHYN